MVDAVETIIIDEKKCGLCGIVTESHYAIGEKSSYTWKINMIGINVSHANYKSYENGSPEAPSVANPTLVFQHYSSPTPSLNLISFFILLHCR